MTQIHEVVVLSEYEAMVDAKYVREQTHPDFPDLVIANYTESATWDRVWNDTTLQCRGLIYSADTGEVLARPFRKFFNYEQEEAPKWDLDTMLHVTDKMDGSLGILYIQPDGQPAIATRGSFASDQAKWATAHFREKYADRPELLSMAKYYTFLFEIIYPENRIVVDYGDRAELVLIGVVEIETGESVDVDLPVRFGDWNGPVVPIFKTAPLSEILTHPPRENAEGYVLWHEETDTRVKIKYEDYKVLHRFMTNTTEKHVWEVLSTGQDPAAVFAAAPDEFHEWLKFVVADFQREYDRMEDEAISYWDNERHWLPEGYSRKEFANAAGRVPQPYRAMMFLLEDNRSLDEFIWKQLKPVGGGSTMRYVSPDAG